MENKEEDMHVFGVFLDFFFGFLKLFVLARKKSFEST